MGMSLPSGGWIAHVLTWCCQNNFKSLKTVKKVVDYKTGTAPPAFIILSSHRPLLSWTIITVAATHHPGNLYLTFNRLIHLDFRDGVGVHIFSRANPRLCEKFWTGFGYSWCVADYSDCECCRQRNNNCLLQSLCMNPAIYWKWLIPAWCQPYHCKSENMLHKTIQQLSRKTSKLAKQKGQCTIIWTEKVEKAAFSAATIRC